jgi:haloalkane dehalogenase
LRSPEGERAVLERNLYVEELLIARLGYHLSEQDKAEYRRPFLTPGESRRPTLEWARQLPFGDQPADTAALVRSYSSWVHDDTRVPKLFIRAIPGGPLFADPEIIAYIRRFENQSEISIYGPHDVEEVAPAAIGRALAEWIASLA